MAEDVLLVDPGPITRLTLNRPRAHNAIDTDLGDRLLAALLTVGRNPEVKVIILRGSGRSFCSGDDRNEGPLYHNDDIEAVGLEAHGYYQLMKAIRRVPQAVIAQVHGYCLGSGMDLLLAADFAVADPEAQLGMVFGARGIMGGSVFLPRYVGLKQANRLLLRLLRPGEGDHQPHPCPDPGGRRSDADPDDSAGRLLPLQPSGGVRPGIEAGARV